MQGVVVKISPDPTGEGALGIQIGKFTFPVPLREVDIRGLALRDPVSFITTREGNVEIITPKPRLGCERER